MARRGRRGDYVLTHLSFLFRVAILSFRISIKIAVEIKATVKKEKDIYIYKKHRTNNSSMTGFSFWVIDLLNDWFELSGLNNKKVR